MTNERSGISRYCDTGSLRGYPEAIRSLPFCVWKMEKVNGRMTKVPYNPKSGFKAAVDKPGTFSDLDTALDAMESGGYSGVGINISGNIGCIDVDKCVGNDGGLSETAEKVLALFPEAFIELSPSGTGLHLYFLVPEEFSYDVEEYYINCGKYGLEIYLPGVTKHFLTVTGNMYREGNMDVTAYALEQFRDQFMKRPQLQPVEISPPEEGSGLTDAEVLRLCASSQGGQTFIRYYQGDWEKPEDVNWSHSHADLSVCRRLAFFCRGDMAQMDRIFRESELMRDKWDRPLSGSTYGRVTMQNAIRGCTSFYDPNYKTPAETDFAEESTDTDGADDAEEAFDAVETGSEAQRLDAFLSRELTLDDILSPEFLELAMWANQEDLPRYMQVKDKVPKNLGIRRFEQEMKRQHQRNQKQDTAKAEMLALTGQKTKGMIVPERWIVNDNGIWHFEMVFGELKPVSISLEPVYVSAKVVNVDNGTEKLEVTFRRNGSYKSLVAPRSDLLSKNAVIKYADFGFPVSSSNAAQMTKYLAEMEAVNNHAIPVKRGINRAGWVGNEFYPYEMKDAVQFHDDDTGTTNLVEALHTHGSEERWLELAAQVRTYPFARFMLAVSFASPLLSKVSHRNIYSHIWFESRGGKTAVTKLALGVWGDPDLLMGTYNATIFGLEQRCATLKHLPVALDELQSLKEKYMSVNDVVYNLGNGIGKTRGKIGSGIRRMDGWNTCILSTGEQPMSSDSSMDGVNTRLLEINACPLMNGEGLVDNELGIRLHTEAKFHYGFAGEKYIHYLIHQVIGEKMAEDGTHPALDKDYQMILDRLTAASTEEARTNPHFSSVAIIALADYYSSIAVFDETPEQAADEAVEMASLVMERIEADKPMDSIQAAWNYVVNWIASNSAHFINPNAPVNTLYPPKEVSPIYGLIEKEKVYVIASDLNKALSDGGFSYRKCIRGFQRSGSIDTFVDSEGKKRTQVARVIKGVQTRVYALNLKTGETEWLDTDGSTPFDDLPPFTDPAEPLV